MAGDGLARTALASTTSVSNNLALAGMAEWENSGVNLLKQLLYQFQTSIQLPMNFGVDGTGVDVTFYGDTAGVNMLWDYSADKFDVTNAKMDWYRDTTVANPGRMITWGDTHAGTLTASPTTFQVSATFNGAATTAYGVTGAEIKARHTTGNASTVGQLRGVVGNVDTKNGTTTTAYAVEGSVDVSAGGTITTSACFHGNLNNSGTVTTSYGAFMEGVSGYVLTRGFYAKYCTYGYYADNVVEGAYLSSDAGTIASESHGVDIVSTGTLASGKGLVGLNVAVTTAGTAGAWASGIYAKVTQSTTKNVNGYLSGAEFEVVNTNTNPSDWFPLVLNANSTNNGQHSSYIACRSYGTLALNSLFWIEDQTIGNDGNVTSLVAANNPTAATHTIKIIIDDTAYYLMVCNAGALAS